ncbi:retrovirus-related pol polyprotein from transposon TNT 1-94 [Tanacetum coccineum]
MTEFPQLDSVLVVPVFSQGDDPIACLNKAMAFLSVVASLRGGKGKFIMVLAIRVMLQVLGETIQVDMQGLLNAITVKFKEKAMLAEALEAGQVFDEEQLAFLADPGIPDVQVVQTTIPDNVAFQTEDLDAYDSDCDDVSNAKAVLMANLSSYGSDVISEVPNSESYHNDMDNQSVHAVQDFEQSLVVNFTYNEIISDSNIIPYSQYLQETQHAPVQDTNLYVQQDSMILSVIEQISREKMIGSQMDNMIKDKLALRQQIDSLEKNLSNQIKENESLLQTFTVFKNESKEKENKYMDKEIDLEMKITELDNIVYKLGQSAQTLHIVISNKHVVMLAIDDEETLILEEVSRSKMSEKEKDPEAVKQNISYKSIDYVKLNQLFEDFGKLDVPSELPKVSLVNTSLKKIKFHLAKFDSVVKKRTTPDALTEGEWGNGESVNLDVQKSESCDKCLDLDAKISKTQSVNQNALEIPEYFENNDLRAHLQAKDTTICFACKHAKRIQELLVYVGDTSPNKLKLSEKKVAVKPINKVKKFRFSKPSTSSSNIKQVVQIVLWYLDSRCSKYMTENRSQLMNFVSKFLGTVLFENYQIVKIMGYGDYQLGNVTISRVYYVEGLGHNLFSAGKFCDADLEVAFRKNTCFIYNLDGVDLLSGSRDTNLYIISLDDMLKISLICLLSKASKTKSWLWHRRLSHLNFDTINKLAKDDLARGISKLKFQKDHLCSTCALGKRKKSSH